MQVPAAEVHVGQLAILRDNSGELRSGYVIGVQTYRGSRKCLVDLSDKGVLRSAMIPKTRKVTIVPD